MEHTWPDDFNEDLNRDVIRLSADARFRAWVFSPTSEREAYWTQYVLLRPDREEAVRQARLLVLALQMPDYSLTEEAVASRTERLRKRIRTRSSSVESTSVRSVWSGYGRWAAAAVFLLGLGWWGYHQRSSGLPATIAHSESIHPSLPNEKAGTVTAVVTNEAKRRVTLPDGSVVTLAPHSVLRYTHLFGQIDRTVALAGQGFFEVIRNPKKPFFVYTNSVVTRVLGTSFLVQNRTGRPAIVTVHTGKVSVYERAHFSANPYQNKGILLTSNQQAIFHPADGVLTRSLVAKPLPLQTTIPQSTDFDDRPLTEVIDVLVKTYGIPISYDRDQLSQCRVTVILDKEPFFDQLTLLCKLVEGRYEVTDSAILFYADGC